MDQDKTERVVMLLQLMRREEGRNALRLLSHSLMDHLFSSSQPATHVHVVRACLRACVLACVRACKGTHWSLPGPRPWTCCTWTR